MSRPQRNAQLIRQLRLLTLLTTGRYQLDRLAFVLGVTTRTIRRDLEALESALVPVRTTDPTGRLDYLYLDSKACPLCRHPITDSPLQTSSSVEGAPLVIPSDHMRVLETRTAHSERLSRSR